MRSMALQANGKVIYSSTFNLRMGTIVRTVEVPRDRYLRPWADDAAFAERYKGRTWDRDVFSPVPETIDVAITDQCGFGCSYCYMDSQPKREHAPTDLVDKVIQGFDLPPYQMAIGGGEPTQHPDFTKILRRVRELGTVPNYTTNGAKLIPSVVEATNEVCGGVAMTYHAFKGIDWFVSHYKALTRAIEVQINVHVIADKNVATSLDTLVSKRSDTGPLRIVLLAYYPDVGRATLDSLITKKVYQRDLPAAIFRAQGAGFEIAFSEGLSPYFFSRPELKVNTTFAMRSEGLFSCFVDTQGRMSTSSFDPPKDEEDRPAPSIWKEGSQVAWNNLGSHRGEPNGDRCYDCKFRTRCANPHEFHYLLCDFASHNEKYTPRE